MKSSTDAPGTPTLSPLLDQYFSLKEQCRDALLLFRVGDFYEAYGADAEALSRALEIVLTGRDVKGARIPMAGVPHHTLDNHLKTLLTKGLKVAVSEQMEEPSQAKGLIERDIVRFLTPGTILEGDLLNEKEPNFLLAISPSNQNLGLSWADVSTGAWYASVIPAESDALRHELAKIAPKEILLPDGSEAWKEDPALRGIKVSFTAPDGAAPALPGFPEDARSACGLLTRYLKEVYRGNPPHLSPPVFDERKKYLVLDPVTCRNLELFQNLSGGGREGSLLQLLDRTETPMGGRLLRQWLLYPLVDSSEIARRQEAIQELTERSPLMKELHDLLAPVGDLERLTSRVSFQTANARDLLAIQMILQRLPRLSAAVAPLSSEIFRRVAEHMPDFSPLTSLLNKALHPDPPLGLKDGNLIKEGFNPELDGLKRDLREATAWIAELEEKEKKATGIRSLKVAYNQVFGYYIEITRPNLPLAPKHYIRKQTMANAERFVTEDLKAQEAKILRAQEKVKNLEYDLFCELRNEARKEEAALRAAAALLATIDALAGLAEIAVERNFSRPEVDDGEALALTRGRHPVVEAGALEPFVPNNALLDGGDNRLLVVTGPNMAGKSTYLRQVALIVIMAQMGSFVPAEAAKIGVVDRIFTRIGASDDLHRGESTFFVEMRETAEILKRSTRKSLVLLDEIGRGTSTFDGLSLAWATAEELLRSGAKVLFATHYHEMTSLARRRSGVQNFTVAVKEEGEEVVFLRQIVPGGSDKSYGIHVARLAGIPEHVVERAKEVLESLEEKELGKKIKGERVLQLNLFSPQEHPLVKALKETDPNAMTGLQALNLLSAWKESFGKE